MEPWYLRHVRSWSGSIDDRAEVPPLTSASKLKAIIAVFGAGFLRYALALPAESGLESALSNTPKEVINTLSLAAHDYMRGRFGLSITDYDGLANTFGLFDQEAGTSIVNAMRLDCGGELPVLPETDDPLLAPLLSVARDLWPVLLLPPSRLPGWNQPHFSLRCSLSDEAPQRSLLVDAVLEDADLGRLFTTVEDEQTFHEADYVVHRGKDARGGWASSSFDSHYMTVDLSLFLSNLIKAAAIQCVLGGSNLCFDQIAAELDLIVGRIRRLASGDEAVEMPAVVGISGLSVEAGRSLHVGPWLLRAPTEWERSWLFPGVEELTAVLVGQVPVQWDPMGDTTFPPELDSNSDIAFVWPRAKNLVNTRKHLSVLVDQVRLAVTLSSPRDAPLGVRPTGYASWVDPAQSSPLAFGGTTVQLAGASLSGLSTRGAIPGTVAQENLDQWWPIISSRGASFVSSIAVQRTLQALNERYGPDDALIDIMIALESLIGGNQEMSFKLAAYVARTIAPDDAERRLTTFNEVKDLYSIRSGLVHGSHVKKPLPDASARAMVIAVEVLRRLLENDRNLPLDGTALAEYLLA